MIRKHLALALAMVVASGGAALATTSSSASPVTSQRVRSIPNAAACGGTGFTLITAPETKAGFLCTHSSVDRSLTSAQFRQIYGPTRAARTPATAKVPCYGNGQSGSRIQMVYGYYEGLPNRGKTVTELFNKTMAPRMQAVINAQSLGQNLGLRFAMTAGCKAIDVKVIEFPREIAFDDDGSHRDEGLQLVGAATYISRLGMNRDDRKYQILWDGYSADRGGFGACGIASVAYPRVAGRQIPMTDDQTLSSAPYTPVSEGLPEISPGLRNVVNISKYSMVFNHLAFPHGPSCFVKKSSLSTVTAAIHELFHTLGAVQGDAPHADRGHCTDAPSVMCPGNLAGYGLGSRLASCSKVLVETLDCGMDDYWNPSPEAGSYLSTHLNIAKSQFFGPQPQDLLGASPL